MKITIEKLRKLVGQEIVWKEQEELYHGRLCGISKSGKYVSVMVRIDEKERRFVTLTRSFICNSLEILDVFD